MSLRDDIRAAVLGAKAGSKLVTLTSGLQIEVRQPTVGYTLDMADEGTSPSRMIQMILDHCYVPGTSDKVFGKEDVEVFRTLPTGGDYDKITTALFSLMDIKEQMASARKNSPGAA